jgi:cytochrome c553
MPAHLLRVAVIALILTAALPRSILAQSPPRDEAARIEFFEKKVRPVLVSNCYTCHSADTNSKGGLRVDDRNGLIHGGGRGPAVEPGHPEKSLLIQAVRHTHAKVKMPPEKHLGDAEIADLERWIKDGAVWPKVELPSSLGKQKEKYAKLKKEHWAWQPLRESPPPPVRDQAWPCADLDRFVLARLEQKDLQPAKTADRATLIRRVTFDLTGLPPTPDAIDSFINDAAPDAFAKVVDRLLASPAYGERWGRHWLDVARYAESTGPSRNIPYPHAWRYRDYVIDAFNRDKPYDQFIREQIAGDLLPAASPAHRDEQQIATGFLALGNHDVNQRFKVRFVMDNVDEQIDTVTRSVLALTASCARCHDHKFDPIPTTDYYALAGIFRSTELCAGIRNKMGGGGLDYYDTAMLLRLGQGGAFDPQMAEKTAQAKAAFEKARAEFQAIFDRPEGKAKGPDGRPKQQLARQKMEKLQQEWVALTDPAVQGPVALGVRDAKTVADTEIRVRGQAEQLGPVVPRGFLSLLDVPKAPKINANQSGRLELAQWLTSDKNPLTPRVMVNRVWKHLFRQGLVGTVDNFGVTGEAPSHPELLDYLATRFVADGWSIKRLVRTIVLSRTYQLSAETSPANIAVDPGNRLLWRHSPRRLEAEEIRDAMLAVAGRLDPARPMGSLAKDFKVIELSDSSPQAKKLGEEAAKSVHRSVYLPLLRGLTPRALEVFDFAEQGFVTGSRDSTTVAPQALYLLNDPFVRQQATGLADRLMRDNVSDVVRISVAYRLTLGRAATAKEIERATSYLVDYAAALADSGAASRAGEAAWASFCQALLASAEFRYLQ